MADDRTILLSIELDTSDLEKKAKDAAAQITELKARQKELRDEGKQDSVEYKKLGLEIQRYNKELTSSIKAIQATEMQQVQQTGSLREMRQALADAKLQYAEFSQQQRESAEGQEFVKAMKDLKDSITEIEVSFGTFTGKVGDYEGAIKKVLSEMDNTEKQINKVGFAYGENKKKVDDNTQALDRLKKEGKENTIGFQQIRSEIESLTVEMSTQESEINELNSSYEKQKIILSEVSEQARKVGFVYGQAAEETALLEKSFEDIATSTDSLEDKFDQLNKKVEATPKTLNGLNAQMEAYKAIALQAGDANDEVIRQQALERAGALKDQYVDLEREVNNLANDQKNLQGLMEIGQGAIASFGLYQSAMASLGIEGEEFQDMLIKLQAAQTALSSLQQISVVIQKQSAAAQLLQAQASRVQATAMAISNKLFGEGTKLAKGFSKALMFTGIGALIAGLAAVAANWEEIKSALSSTSKEQAILNEHLDDYKQGAAEAITKTNQVETAFRLAEKGVISKDEALQTYNDTLGDSFGKMDNLNDAEETFIKKKDAFIQATAQRALATALFAKAAEEQANAVTASLENQISTTDVVTKSFTDASFTTRTIFGKNEAEIKKMQAEGVKEAKKTATERFKLLLEEGRKALELAETIEGANDIISEDENKLADARKKRADEQKKLQEEAMKRAQELARKMRDLANLELDLSLSDERAILEAHYQFLETIADGNAEELLKIQEQKNADIAALEQKELARSIELINQKYADEIAAAEQNAELIAALTSAKNAEIESIEQQYRNAFTQRSIELIEQQRDFNEERVKSERQTAEDIKLITAELTLERLKGTEGEFAAWQALQQERIEQLQRFRDQELAIEGRTANEKSKIQKETELQIQQIKNETFQKETEQEQKSVEQKRALAMTAINITQQLSDTLFQIVANRIQKELNALEGQYNTDSKLLEDQLAANLISQADYDAQRSALDATFRAEQSKLKKEQFEKEKAAAIISATIAGSTAVLNALATPPPASFVLAGIAGSLAAAQIGIIASQPVPEFEQGGQAPLKNGVFGGSRHSAGGTKGVFSDGTRVEVERDEAFFILNRKATAAISQLSNHNVKHGGVPLMENGGVLRFEGGGAFAASISSGTTQRFQAQNEIVNIVKALPTPIVPVESIVEATGNFISVKDRASF